MGEHFNEHFMYMPGPAERWVAGMTAASAIWLQQANLKTQRNRECDSRKRAFPIMGMTVRIGTSLTPLVLTPLRL